HPDAFVIGDLALVLQDGKPVPGVAQGAIQGGRYVGRTIARRLAGQPTEARTARWAPAAGRAASGASSPERAQGRRKCRGVARPTEPFRYRDLGSLATIGRAAAVAEIGRLRLAGFFAWVLWLLIHILSLIGFRNRFLVMAQWAWVYLRFER